MRNIEICKKCIQYGNMIDYWCGLDDVGHIPMSWSSMSHSCVNSLGDDGKCVHCEHNRKQREEYDRLARIEKAKYKNKEPHEDCPYRLEHLVMSNAE